MARPHGVAQLTALCGLLKLWSYHTGRPYPPQEITPGAVCSPGSSERSLRASDFFEEDHENCKEPILKLFRFQAGTLLGHASVACTWAQRPMACFVDIYIPRAGTLPGVYFWSSQVPGLRQIDCQLHAGRPDTSHSAVLLDSTSVTSSQVRHLRTDMGGDSIPESTQPPSARTIPWAAWHEVALTTPG